MRRMATLAVAGVAALCAVVGPSVSHAADQLRFVMVSHIGSNDPNMNWLTTSMKTFEVGLSLSSNSCTLSLEVCSRSVNAISSAHFFNILRRR